MKKIVSIALILVLIFSVAATAAFAEKKEVLVFGTSADYAPFEFMYPDESGKMVYGGIDVMVAQYIADHLGMELQIENMDFGYLLDELPEYILIRAEDADKFQDAATDFNGVSVGAQTGSTKVEKAEQNLIGCNVVSLPLVTDLVNELVNGKIDAILLDGSVAVSYDKQYEQLTIAEEASKVFPEPNIQGIEEVSADAPEGYESDDVLLGEEEAEAVEEAAAETK